MGDSVVAQLDFEGGAYAGGGEPYGHGYAGGGGGGGGGGCGPSAYGRTFSLLEEDEDGGYEEPPDEDAREPTGTVTVRGGAELRAIDAGPDVALRAQDELPALFVLAAFARGAGGKAHIVMHVQHARLVMGIKLVIALDKRIALVPAQTHSELAPRLVRINRQQGVVKVK